MECPQGWQAVCECRTTSLADCIAKKQNTHKCIL
jgi:hypothetical protein